MASESKKPLNRIFVGKLTLDADKENLKEHFSSVGEITSVKIMKNVKKNIAYAFINFANENAPQDAVEKFNNKDFKGVELDVQIAKEPQRSKSINKNKKKTPKNKNNNNENNTNGNDVNVANLRSRQPQKPKTNKPRNKRNTRNNNNRGNSEREVSNTMLFVSNLPFSVDDDKLKQIFEGHNPKTAHIVSKNGRRKGFGFVEFETEGDATSALESKSKFAVEEREINIRYAYKFDEPLVQKPVSTDTLYVSNLPYKLTDETLHQIFAEYGVTKAYVARTKKGRSKGFGFVVLEGADANDKQQKAINEKNQHAVQEREIFVRAAYTSDRPETIEQETPSEPEPKQIALYVSNVPFSVTSEELADLFKDCTGFVSANIISKRYNDRSKGYGFVVFDTEENRDNALTAKAETSVGDRQLAISVAKGRKPKSARKPYRRFRRGGRNNRQQRQ